MQPEDRVVIAVPSVQAARRRPFQQARQQQPSRSVVAVAVVLCGAAAAPCRPVGPCGVDGTREPAAADPATTPNHQALEACR
jgi:hypothetical protein